MENKNKNIHLLKDGDSIRFSKSGIDYQFEYGKVYIPKTDSHTDEIILTEGNEISLPEKLYTPKSDEKFINKVLNVYTDSAKSLGILLAGKKGTGKTVMAKQIAIKSNLPIITVDNKMYACDLKRLFIKLENEPACFIFDEFDKFGERYDSDELLRIIDGVSSSGKNLMIFTANNTDDINNYMLDRCGRIRYYREFDEMQPSMITEILKDRLNDPSEASPLTDFIMSNFNLLSFDNVTAFADEVNNYPNETFEDLLEDMNISQK
uniref:ATPase family protein n=1 Tax=Dulem virus 42 TaxID=3145760 RepID=A0AAU8B8F3_9CAUD